MTTGTDWGIDYYNRSKPKAWLISQAQSKITALLKRKQQIEQEIKEVEEYLSNIEKSK